MYHILIRWVWYMYAYCREKLHDYRSQRLNLAAVLCLGTQENDPGISLPIPGSMCVLLRYWLRLHDAHILEGAIGETAPDPLERPKAETTHPPVTHGDLDGVEDDGHEKAYCQPDAAKEPKAIAEGGHHNGVHQIVAQRHAPDRCQWL